MGMDLLVTMATLAGATLPAQGFFDGVDLSQVLLRSERLPERTLFWRYGDRRAVRRGVWKLVQERAQTYLFNLDTDLSETNDLSAEYPEICRDSLNELTKWQNDVTKLKKS
jgi:arylsulfatase A-like enzyme